MHKAIHCLSAQHDASNGVVTLTCGGTRSTAPMLQTGTATATIIAAYGIAFLASLYCITPMRLVTSDSDNELLNTL